MNSIALNSDAIPYGAAISLLVLILATPLSWGLLKGAPAASRAFLGALACIGLAGLVALPVSFAELRLEGTALTVLIFSAALQGTAAIILTLLPRRA